MSPLCSHPRPTMTPPLPLLPDKKRETASSFYCCCTAYYNVSTSDILLNSVCNVLILVYT